MKSCRAVLSVCLVSVSCASIPVTGTAATGAPLEVLETSQTFNVTRKVKVAEVTHRDRVGRKTGTSEVTENRTRRVTEYDWKLMQGDEGVDESDFYRIDGDLERSALVDEKRRGAATLQTLGVLTIPVGIALAVAGVLLAYVPLQTVNDPDTGLPTMAPLLPSLFGYVMVGAGGWARQPADQRRQRDSRARGTAAPARGGRGRGREVQRLVEVSRGRSAAGELRRLAGRQRHVVGSTP